MLADTAKKSLNCTIFQWKMAEGEDPRRTFSTFLSLRISAPFHPGTPSFALDAIEQKRVVSRERAELGSDVF